LIFVGDMCDLFHEDRSTSNIDEVIATVAASRHIGQILTKRADAMAAYFATPRPQETVRHWQQKIWLGFSAERQAEFDSRWAHVRQLAGSGWTVFTSIAPMLAPVVLPAELLAYGERVWVICSGEQGRGARWMNPSWARALRDQCAASGVPFFLLQMGSGKPIPADLFVRQFPAVRFATLSQRHQG
jgi:protein gp37